MKLSIIIPVYNQSTLVVKSISSIPIRDDIEIIVVNDGSTDDTLKVVKAISRPITIISYPENRGVAYAENRGFDKATGEYLMRLDSDDYLYPEAFIRSLDYLDGTDIVYYNLRNNNGVIYYGTPENARERYSGALKYIRRAFLGDMRNDESLRFMEDRELYDRLVAKEPTEKSTNLIVAHYNNPRMGSLCWAENEKLKKVIQRKVVLFYHTVQPIGGIETWIYSLAQLYKDTGLVLVYMEIDPDQLARIEKHIPTFKWDGHRVECETFIFCYHYTIIDFVTAENYLFWIHGDFEALRIKVPIPKQTTAIYGVAKHVAESFKRVHERELIGRLLWMDWVYNPFIKENVKRTRNDGKIRLISATRLTREKGWERMKKLYFALEFARVDFEWHLYTNEVPSGAPPFKIFKPRLDIHQEIANADYLVQLSDTEGMPYAIWESLSVGTPVIVTDIPAMRELNLTSKQAIVLDLAMQEVSQVPGLLKQFRVKGWKPPQDLKKMRQILENKLGGHKMEKDSKFIVRANNLWKFYDVTDARTGEIPAEGDEWEVDFKRLQVLLGDNIFKRAFVEVVKEVKKAPKKAPAKKK